jgi:protein-disulfide isomerase
MLPRPQSPRSRNTRRFTFNRIGLRSRLLGTLLCLAPLLHLTCTGTDLTPAGSALAIVESDHVLGSPDAPVTVIEYANLHCSWCGLFARTDFPTIKAQYIDTNRVRWVYRHFLTMSSDTVALSACAAECAADQGRFYEYISLVFQNQADQSEATLKQHATALGLDRGTFDACLSSGTKLDHVRQDLTSGEALGVNSTPRFFVDTEEIRGYQTAEQLGQILDRHLGGG